MNKNDTRIEIKEIDAVYLRRNICKSCPEKKKFFNNIEYCGQCYCVIYLKTAISSEKCPLEKW
ncbi:MAG: hypothetical protein EB127_02530 [Alphaproteobacteria bacterium]|nr:hypothetical protein [Alphaproteobacteria bacterium]